ncbi:MAG: hypothetical protein WCD76_15995, partial [Pyrinomonadaceae bacterium]
MSRIRQVISLTLVLTLLSLGVTAQAQRRVNRMNDRQIGELIRRVEVSSGTFRSSLDSSLDRSRYDGTRSEDNINSFVRNFESATTQLRERFDRRAAVASDVENVLRQALDINNFIANNRLNQRVKSDWSLVRTDLGALANAYGVAWDWNQTSPTVGGGGIQPYRINDQQVEQIIRRVETRANVFRDDLNQSLDRNSRYDGTRAEDNINQFVRDFENATDRLRSRFNSRTSVAADVENVLQRAAVINEFLQRNRLNNRVQNDWSLLRTDLNSLASAYSVASNWDTNNNNTYPATTYPSPVGTNNSIARLTGTYRLDPTRSDNARDVADRATRTLPINERQRIYDNLITRLDSPDMLAIERRGSTVAIASTRAPQTSFEADGRERTEQLPNGQASRVSARLNGDQLVVTSAGFRETDFNVTFEPLEGGRRLRVTRQIWNPRIGQNPVIVQNVYDRTSDVADFNVYNGANSYPSDNASVNSGDFIVPNGTTLIATLNSNLSTRDTQNGDRFTMTVRSPAEYDGATIEGTVSNVGRSGRVTGRSELSLNLNTIRLRNGQSYRFAGFIESARTNGGETVQVDNEGAVREGDSRGQTTAQRAAIG